MTVKISQINLLKSSGALGYSLFSLWVNPALTVDMYYMKNMNHFLLFLYTLCYVFCSCCCCCYYGDAGLLLLQSLLNQFCIHLKSTSRPAGRRNILTLVIMLDRTGKMYLYVRCHQHLYLAGGAHLSSCKHRASLINLVVVKMQYTNC